MSGVPHNRKCKNKKKSVLETPELIPVEQFKLRPQLETDRYAITMTKQMTGKEFTLSYLQSNGFGNPVVFRNKKGLGIQVPRKFSVRDVLQYVEDNRMVYVQCCITQTTERMELKKFVEYYQNKGVRQEKAEVWNVISFEISDTKMNDLVSPPNIVSMIDWLNIAFPDKIKQYKVETPNSLKSYYPKVEKYCLMSVAGSYTHFHVDFGGTSVWYHVLKGRKIFWLIEPTAENLGIFKQWKLTNNESEFLGDLVGHCERVELEAGMTFVMPSGWIHAVYTPEDSIVFGGNFLHFFNAPMQEQVAQLEVELRRKENTKYPYRAELKWYVLEYYTYHLNRLMNKPDVSFLHPSYTRKQLNDPKLSNYELDGLSEIIKSLDGPPPNGFYVEGIEDLKGLYEASKDALQNYQDTIIHHSASGKRTSEARASENSGNSTTIAVDYEEHCVPIESTEKWNSISTLKRKRDDTIEEARRIREKILKGE